MPIGDIKEEFYEGETFDTLEKLEVRVQADEEEHFGPLTELVLAEQEGKHGTKGKFVQVRPRDMKIGLIFREFTTDGEVRLIETKLEAAGNTKMFQTTVLIGNSRKKITIFRKKQT